MGGKRISTAPKSGTARRGAVFSGLLACGMGAFITGAQAQDLNAPGLHLTFDFAQRFETDSNRTLSIPRAGSSFHSTTKLGFGLVSTTRTQSLHLNAGASLRLINEPSSASELLLDEPYLDFDYKLDAASSALHLDGYYLISDISLITSDDADLFGPGDRETYGLAGEIEIGKEAPFGLTLRAGHDVKDYSGTTAASLFDTTRTNLGLTARLRFSPVSEGNFRIDHDTYKAEDTQLTERRTSRYSFGLTRALSKTATLDAAIGYNRIETDQTIGGLRSTTEVDGATGALGLTYAMANGELTADLDRRVNQNGGRTNFSIGRALELPRGSFGASIGATRGQSDTTRLIGGLNWRHDLPRGNLSADLSRSVTNGDDDEDQLRTRLSLAYNHEINTVSSFGVSLSQTLNDNINTGILTENSRFGVTYSHELTRDWNMDLGYNYRTRKETGLSRAKSHAVFLEISRRFSIR